MAARFVWPRPRKQIGSLTFLRSIDNQVGEIEPSACPVASFAMKQASFASSIVQGSGKRRSVIPRIVAGI